MLSVHLSRSLRQYYLNQVRGVFPDSGKLSGRNLPQGHLSVKRSVFKCQTSTKTAYSLMLLLIHRVLYPNAFSLHDKFI